MKLSRLQKKRIKRRFDVHEPLSAFLWRVLHCEFQRGKWADIRAGERFAAHMRRYHADGPPHLDGCDAEYPDA